jgi:four helix bundle protein
MNPMADKDTLRSKSYFFAINIIRLAQELISQKEFILSKQITRSGTAIGALMREAQFGESRTDFKHKMHISLKDLMKPCIGYPCFMIPGI